MISAPESDSEASLSLDDCDVPVVPIMPLMADEPVAPSVPATPPTPASGSGAKLVSCSITLAEDGRNYIPWQTLVTAVIQNHPDAHKVISGTLVVRAAGYDQANALAKTIILNSISQGLIATHFSNGIGDARDVALEARPLTLPTTPVVLIVSARLVLTRTGGLLRAPTELLPRTPAAPNKTLSLATQTPPRTGLAAQMPLGLLVPLLMLLR